MQYKIKNNTGSDFSVLESLIEKFFPYAQENMGFDRSVTIVLESDLENAQNPLGKTAYYSPSDDTVVLYTDNRHPKDLMRSLSHELVHHKQNCNGELSEITGEQGYAQTEIGHKIEEEAYSLGNTCFRNWEDQIKGETPMNEEQIKNTIKEAIRRVLNEVNITDDSAPEEIKEETSEEAVKETVEETVEEPIEENEENAEEVNEDNTAETTEDVVEDVAKEKLNEWWNNTVYNKLLKEYTRRNK